MRFINAIGWMLLVTAFFILSLAAVSFIPLDFIGQGNPIANINFYILDQNPNLPRALRDQNAQDVLFLGVFKLLIYLTIFWILINIFWIAVAEFLNVDRPSKAIKFLWLWFVFFIICISITLIMTYWFLYAQDQIWHYVGFKQIIGILIYLAFPCSVVFFYLCSIFTTSRVMRPAVPLLNIILRN